MKKKPDVLFGIAAYRKEDWQRLREISADKNQLEDTWKSWKHEYIKTKKNMKKRGMTIVEVFVDIDELINYCKKHGLEINANARARFAADRVRLMQKKASKK